MNILEFELRVKRFAYPQNKGFVNTNQLMKAFEDNLLFDRLMEPRSVSHKFFLSPFVADFPIGS